MAVVLRQDVKSDVETLYRDGISSLRGAFSTDLVDGLREDLEAAYAKAINRPGGAVSRGPQRWYVEIHPEELRAFAEICAHPWLTAMSEAVLGAEYKVVEVGFDVPFEGAKNQPWHRDFASPPETWRERRITSLAFNMSGVDVTDDMGPFEIAIGTQFDDGRSWNHEMFPPKDEYERFAAVAQRKFPRRGDLSCRTALAVHRGTAHASPVSRPVLIVGVVAGEVANPDEHDLVVTRAFYEALPISLREHLLCRVVDELEPISQRHDIEGLVMGAED